MAGLGGPGSFNENLFSIENMKKNWHFLLSAVVVLGVVFYVWSRF